jgi:hypothetical protein
MVEEEEKSPTMVKMEIDLHEPIAKGNPQQPARAEAAHRTNGGDNEKTESYAVRPQPGGGFV